MRRLVGILFMLLGAVTIFFSGLLLMNNRQEDRAAQVFAEDVMPQIYEQIHSTPETVGETEAVSEVPEYTPAEFLKPEDLAMTEKTIKGYSYIGYLTIPELNLELPVMSDWDSKRLQISPCRYTGTVKGEDLVIMAHNFRSHFGQLPQLAVGSAVQFVDMDGKVWHYEVAAMDVLAAESVEEMTSGEYDLTLFTCAKNRTHRVTVRCNMTEKPSYTE